MAAIHEVLVMEDRFTPVLTRYLSIIQRSAGASDDMQASLLNIETATARTAMAVEEMSQQISQYGSSTRQARTQTDSLMNSIKKLVGAYAGIKGVQTLLNLSDTYASNTARIDMMNDGLQTTAELQNQIYQAAQRSRGSYQATTNLVAKLGTLAGDAFSNSAETVAFAEQLNKQIALSGASTQAADAAMLQLIQGLSSGTLRGEELNSILEQPPTIAQTIAGYMGVTTGEMRELASEGAVTASVVKNALLSSAEETNAKFAEMPMTWGQVWTSAVNTITKAAEPLLSVINSLANLIGNNMDVAIGVFYGLAAAVTFYAIAQSIATGAAQTFFSTLMSHPILLAIAAAIGVVIAVIYKWVQAVGGIQVAWLVAKDSILYAFDYLKIGLFTGIYAVMNFLDQMSLKFQSVGVAVANFIGDMKVNVLTILQGMVNGAIDIINSLINTVNKIPGVAISTIESVTFATTAAAENEAAKLARAQDLADSTQAFRQAVADRQKSIDNMVSEMAANHLVRQQEIQQKRMEQAAGVGSGEDASSYYPSYDEWSRQADGIEEANGTLKDIEKSVKMSDEDIKSLVDMAERRYVNKINLTAQTPVININGQNTGNTAADRKALAAAIQEVLMEQIASTSVRSTAMAY